MTKKIMLLAMAAVSAAMLALPGTALAVEEDIPLHLLNPTPASAVIDDVNAVNPTLTTVGGTKIECGTFSGNATFEAGGTTGHMELTFGSATEPCTSSGLKCNSNPTNVGAGIITTTELPFHLVTLEPSAGVVKPGVLVTPNADGSFAHIECAGGLVKFTVTGNGVLGTITEPPCGSSGNMATVKFTTSGNGVQADKKVAGTAVEYTLKKGTENAGQTAEGTLTMKDSSGNSVSPTLECT
jgi:hypothetical protein